MGEETDKTDVTNLNLFPMMKPKDTEYHNEVGKK